MLDAIPSNRPTAQELVDRARVYLAVCERQKNAARAALVAAGIGIRRAG